MTKRERERESDKIDDVLIVGSMLPRQPGLRGNTLPISTLAFLRITIIKFPLEDPLPVPDAFIAKKYQDNHVHATSLAIYRFLQQPGGGQSKIRGNFGILINLSFGNLDTSIKSGV